MTQRFFFKAFLLLVLAASPSFARSRIKDIVDVQGVRSNLLIGYGLVVGLKGTGDSLRSSAFTRESIVAMLQHLGIKAEATGLDTKDVAAVMVTATLPPFARQGSHIDITASALGDASSLRGGQLLMTPLKGADNAVYAAAQGTLAVNGFAVSAPGSSVTRGVPTTARISNGAEVEREIPFRLNSLSRVTFSLHNPDFTTARRISKAINALTGLVTSRALDPGTVQLQVPPRYKGRIVDLITDVEQLSIEPDSPAKVIVNERSGIVVINSHVRVNQVAIAQGNLTISITNNPVVSQPLPFSNTGTTKTVPRSTIKVEEEKHKLGILNGSVSLRTLVNGLNRLGVSPRNLIAILQALKAEGALQADIEVM